MVLEADGQRVEFSGGSWRKVGKEVDEGWICGFENTDISTIPSQGILGFSGPEAFMHGPVAQLDDFPEDWCKDSEPAEVDEDAGCIVAVGE